jgi:hypothetical protein
MAQTLDSNIRRENSYKGECYLFILWIFIFIYFLDFEIAQRI